MRVCVRFRIEDYAGLRSTILTAGLVLKNAAEAVQLSNMMRILPQSGGERRLVVSGISVFGQNIHRLRQAHVIVFSEKTQTTYVHEWNFNAL